MTDWSFLDGLDPLASHTGPFPHRGFLAPWWRHRGDGELIAIRHGGAAAALVDRGGVVRFAGDADLTDYHSPLGSDLEGLVAGVTSTLDQGTRLVLDSLPIEAAEGLVKHFAAAGVALAMQPADATMVLGLPADPDGYLEGIDPKQRHEVRRKRRRFAEEAGMPRVVRDPEAFPWFAATHRTAPGEKGEFMSESMEEFFAALVDSAGGVVDVLVDGAGRRVAAAFGFEDEDTYYLYNSCFDPDRRAVSPGIVLVAGLIEAAIVSGRRRFDFLKGGEDYKVRLGASPRPLFTVEGAL